MSSIHKNPQSGFTLIEMMVTIVIFSFFTSMYVFQGRAGQSRIVNDDLAYKVALSVREVQNYGISVKEYKAIGATTGIFTVGYGIDFTTVTTANANKSYFIFADLPVASTNVPNGKYDSTDPKIETPALTGAQVDYICTKDTNSQKDCSHTDLSIVFVRPNPVAIIYSPAYPTVSYLSVEIRIKFTNNTYRYLYIRKTGEIDVSETPLMPESAMNYNTNT